MSEATPLPTPEEIADRIRACREELAALKKLQRLVSAEWAAREAHGRRQAANRGSASRRRSQNPAHDSRDA